MIWPISLKTVQLCLAFLLVNLSKFDKSLESSANNIFDSHSEDQENNQKMILRLGEARQQAIKTKSIFKGLQVARDFADELSIDLVTDTEFRSVNANNVECEWAIAPIMVSGDSAGGNLAHMVTQWSIKNAPRKPNCLISFSPSLDQTFTSPSLISNQASDPILGAGLSLLTRLPKAIRLWLLTISMRAYF